MSKPRILDLFCGAGGAAMGYHQAGFEVVGVDVRPQPRYPFTFVQADALEFLRTVDRRVLNVDAIHASPPCQLYSPLSALSPAVVYPDLVSSVRHELSMSRIPWVIENVMTAPLLGGVMLCGTMFGLRTYRHRRFESSEYMWQLDHPVHIAPAPTKGRKDAWENGAFASVTGDTGTYMAVEAMGIDWMTGDELREAIPPAYTEWVGRMLLRAIASKAAA